MKLIANGPRAPCRPVRDPPLTKRILPFLIGLVIVALASFACGGDEEKPAAPSAQTAAQAATASTAGSTKIKAVGNPGSYKYEPAAFAFKVGDTIEFAVEGDSDTHTFTVDDLDVDEFIETNQTLTFSVTFNQAGTFNSTAYHIPR